LNLPVISQYLTIFFQSFEQILVKADLRFGAKGLFAFTYQDDLANANDNALKF
jgi:hypothetical protein